MKEDAKEIYERQVKEANDIKAVINSKGWKETIAPCIIRTRDKILHLSKTEPFNPYCATKAVWMIEGIDSVLAEINAIVAAGEQAKNILAKSDTITKL